MAGWPIAAQVPYKIRCLILRSREPSRRWMLPKASSVPDPYVAERGNVADLFSRAPELSCQRWRWSFVGKYSSTLSKTFSEHHTKPPAVTDTEVPKGSFLVDTESCVHGNILGSFLRACFWFLKGLRSSCCRGLLHATSRPGLQERAAHGSSARPAQELKDPRNGHVATRTCSTLNPPWETQTQPAQPSIARDIRTCFGRQRARCP